GNAARVAPIVGHEHAAEDLPVPPAGSADRGGQPQDAHAGAVGADGGARRADSGRQGGRDARRDRESRAGGGGRHARGRAGGDRIQRRGLHREDAARLRAAVLERAADRRRGIGPMTPSDPVPAPKRDHYSYAHYANPAVAEGFDALRFSGDVGRFLLEEQARLLEAALDPSPARRILDVGTGTGRAAIGLARRGARVTGLDASIEMIGVARVRAADAGVRIPFAVADAHALPVPDRSVDAAVSLRVIMHALDWRRCIAELCRVSRWRVVVDFPSSRSFAAIESAVRRRRLARGEKVEAYRVL